MKHSFKANVRVVDLNTITDSRGSLIAIENNIDIPFDVKRVYYIFNVADSTIKRGFHAHIKLKQLLVAVSGSCTVKCIFGSHEEKYTLNSPRKGLLIEGLVWREMLNFSKDAVLLVLASDFYDKNDYIRTFKEFYQLSSN